MIHALQAPPVQRCARSCRYKHCGQDCRDNRVPNVSGINNHYPCNIRAGALDQIFRLSNEEEDIAFFYRAPVIHRFTYRRIDAELRTFFQRCRQNGYRTDINEGHNPEEFSFRIHIIFFTSAWS